MKRPTPTPPVVYPLFVAVRLNTEEGREWYDTSCLCGCADVVRLAADETNAKIPGWAKVHPVVRYARVLLSEVPT